MISSDKHQSLKVLGIMSGTSLDALDFALCSFEPQADKYRYKILETASYPLTKDWQTALKDADQLSAQAFLKLENRYSELYVNCIEDFQQKVGEIDLLSIHGQTIFHQPDEGFGYQLLNPALIHAKTQIPLVADFRREDIARGGQGAPLVPIGDFLLFPGYSSCLNLGGFANVSFQGENGVMAYDISFCNRVLNRLVHSLDLDYDEDGKLARSGNIHSNLLEELNQLDYYRRKAPKSLGEEYLIKEVYPILDSQSLPVDDILSSCVEHIAIQIGSNLPPGDCLVSGGGGKNKYLIDRIQKHSKAKIIVADDELLEFKEALIFSFLGYLRICGKANVLAKTTGLENDSLVGCIYGY